MAAHVAILIDTESYAKADLVRKLRKGNRWYDIRALLPFIRGVISGVFRATVRLQVGSGATVVASQTVTCGNAAAVNGTDTITIGGVTLAVVASPANQNQFLKGASDAAFATNLAAAINAHTTLQQYVVASALAAVVTIRGLRPGIIYNLVALTEVGNGFTLGGSALANGAGLGDTVVKTYVFGA